MLGQVVVVATVRGGLILGIMKGQLDLPEDCMWMSVDNPKVFDLRFGNMELPFPERWKNQQVKRKLDF